MNKHNQFRSFTAARGFYKRAFKFDAEEVRGMNWQGTNISDKPDMVTHELAFQSFEIDLSGIVNRGLEGLREDISPNLPWADDHFEERVCGWPINPGIEWANWPWKTSADSFRKDAKFNHNYMERLWPRFAGLVPEATRTTKEWTERYDSFISPHTGCSVGEEIEDLIPNVGIYNQYGDLNSLVQQLAFDPLTRQAVIPLYFPEDTGAPDRKPCTLLYQFMRRGNRLHIYYPLRSCDFVRHWADDCYLAVRLLLWVLDQCKKINPEVWQGVNAGEYHMHMTSLHIFANDLRSL